MHASPTPGPPADRPEAVPGCRELVPLGAGRSGRVYRARRDDGTAVAVKVLSVPCDERTRQRFLHEAKLAGLLGAHPHLATVLDAGTTLTGRPYLVTELYELGSLQDRLTAWGTLPAAEAAVIGAKVADALAAAHELGITHGDVRPNTILVSRLGEPALADFGVAGLTGVGGEFAAGLDVRGLASTVHRLVTGEPPSREIDYPESPGLAEVVRAALTGRVGSAAELAVAFRVAAGAPGPRVTSGVPAMAEPKLVPPVARPVPVPTTAPVPVVAAARQENPAPLHQPTWPHVEAARPAPTPPSQKSPLTAPVLLAPPPAAPRPRRYALLLIPLLLVLAVSGTVAVLAATRDPRTPQAVATRDAPAAAAVSPAVLEAARPSTVVVVDEGASATVRWTLPASSRDQLFVQSLSAQSGATARLEPVAAAQNFHRVTGLDPRVGYCFTVGAVVAWGSPSVIAWSPPTCIRGAAAQSAAPASPTPRPSTLTG